YDQAYNAKDIAYKEKDSQSSWAAESVM
uniref:Uncharacterized protein LOC104243862 n=1 Tax=Nicotiana sylvestris TaxID=4096 RepID=A0A1U7Y635_NICSY